MTTRTTVRVMAVEPHPITQMGLRQLFLPEHGVELVAVVRSAREAERVVTAVRPVVLVIELELPDGNGLALTNSPVVRSMTIATAILSAVDNPMTRAAAARAGASAYLSKNDPWEAILDAVRRLGRGEVLLAPGDGARQVDATSGRSGPVDPRSILSPQERVLFQLMAHGPTNREIAERMQISEHTVKNYVSRLLARLELDNRGQVTALASRLDERDRVHRLQSVSGDMPPSGEG